MQGEKAAFICVKDTLDGAYPSLVLGINAARLGMDTKIFYSFMGLNMVLTGGADHAKYFPPGVMGVIPGMVTLATGMMKSKIDKANIPSLGELMEMAQAEGVELIACKMSIDMMEIDESKLLEGVVVWTAEDFLRYARDCKICLFT
ncbi:MAG: DsrE/DsrF/DrsH-like family protein [Humidesulfovibrio sp.]|uniref:DsrE/DsrF/DrsH-like family protein n=1 Tax=Humidesulfovibrio sp. TaxID=2910988 RepID=UPI0027EEF974|nr:DsrE/DsrF/DrsH-like family protein [Humidesulfovibrio sp.]MDQ7836420.1 DsrE/DsrF/DrsH-like family protein [Humidesulfovibrio sp.]